MVVAISIQKNQNSRLFPKVYTVEPGEYLLVVNLAVVSLPRRWRQLNFRHYRSSSFGGCLSTEKASFKSSKDFVVILRLAAAIHCSLVAYIYCTQRCRVGVRANDERKTYNRRYPVVPYVVSPPILPLPYLLRLRACDSQCRSITVSLYYLLAMRNGVGRRRTKSNVPVLRTMSVNRHPTRPTAEAVTAAAAENRQAGVGRPTRFHAAIPTPNPFC